MKPVTFDGTCYRAGKGPLYVNSGEFHYFRVPKQDWRRRMELFKEAGGNCIATYIPWVIHEPEEGRFVFGDRDFNDLEGFLNTAREVGLHVVARPGPYQYSELMYAGLPHWLCDKYPDLLARDIKGDPLRFYSVSYLHPRFIETARIWFDKVCPIIARHTVSRGGSIAFAQVDNELIGIHIWYGSMDYNAETMGFGKPEGRFTGFLANRYGTIERLNGAYGTDKTKFEDVPPPPMRGLESDQELRRRKDYFEFYLGTVSEYAATLAGWLRGHGVDVPIIHNSACPEMNSLFRELPGAVGGEFLLGSDHYYNLDQNWPQNNPTPQYARRTFFSFEMLRLMGFPPTVFEMPGGSASDWPPVTPEDAKTCYMANLALGMKGHNYYIFTGGPNPEGVGSTTDMYDYGAAIGADGAIRKLYHVQKEFGLFIKDRSWLAEAEREHDCRIALDWTMTRAHHYWHARGIAPLHSPEAWKYLLNGPLTTAFCASLSPVFCDLDRDDWTLDRSTPVIFVCSSVMSMSKQERIVRFLRSGGKALILPVLPEQDEAWNECGVLHAFLGRPTFARSGWAPLRLNIAGVDNVCCNGEVFYMESLPDGVAVLGKDERSGKTVCWSVKTEGGGEAMVLGFAWQHAMQEHGRMLKALLELLGLRQKVYCSNPNVWTSLRTVRNRSMLFLMNLLSAPMRVDVKCRPAWSKVAIEAGSHKLPAMSVKTVELSR